jgi:hypothetical protein
MQTMKLTGFHLEPTNRCVLGCSACERTQFIQKFGQKNWHNQDLDLDALVRFMDMDVTGLQWGLCGNTGDPIYYSRLQELISYIKDQQGRIVLTTNGSYRSGEWWSQTLTHLTADDVVEFSVDGLPATSPQYRTNSDWSSIDIGMRTACETSAQVVWKMVPFAMLTRIFPSMTKKNSRPFFAAATADVATANWTGSGSRWLAMRYSISFVFPPCASFQYDLTKFWSSAVRFFHFFTTSFSPLLKPALIP